MVRAPEGHFFTVAMISSLLAFSGVIHGNSLGWKTEARFRTQLAECVHLAACHTMVTSPLEYSFVMFFVSMCGMFCDAIVYSSGSKVQIIRVPGFLIVARYTLWNHDRISDTSKTLSSVSLHKRVTKPISLSSSNNICVFDFYKHSVPLGGQACSAHLGVGKHVVRNNCPPVTESQDKLPVAVWARWCGGTACERELNLAIRSRIYFVPTGLAG